MKKKQREQKRKREEKEKADKRRGEEEEAIEVERKEKIEKEQKRKREEQEDEEKRRMEEIEPDESELEEYLKTKVSTGSIRQIHMSGNTNVEEVIVQVYDTKIQENTVVSAKKRSLKLVKNKKYRKNLTVKSVFNNFDQLKGPGFPKDKA